MFNKSIALTAAAVVAGLMAFSGADTANARGGFGGGSHFFIPGGGMHGGMGGWHGGMGGWHGGMGGWHGGPMMGGGRHWAWNGGGNWHGNNWHNGNWHNGNFHHRHFHDNDNVNVFFGGFGWPYYGGDYYGYGYGYGYGCDPYTNTYIGADGYRHYCY